MESLINRVIYHPLVALPMFYLTDLMCNLDSSLAAALLVIASTVALGLARMLEKRLRGNERLEHSINA
jgi:hypothetical protein